MSNAGSDARPSSEAAPTFPEPIGFARFAALSWRAFRRHFTTLAGVFCVPYTAILLIALAIPLEGRIGLVVLLFTQVFLPVVIGSLAAGIAAIVVTDGFAGFTSTVRDALRELQGRLDDLVIAGSIAGVLAVAFFVFTPIYTLLLLPLFFGPPVVAQTIALEHRSLREAGARSRALTQGQKLRLFMWLFNFALILGLLAFMIFITIAQQTDQSSDLDSSTILLEVVRGLVFGVGAAWLSCSATVIYLGRRAEVEGLDHDDLVRLRENDAQS